MRKIFRARRRADAASPRLTSVKILRKRSSGRGAGTASMARSCDRSGSEASQTPSQKTYPRDIGEQRNARGSKTAPTVSPDRLPR